ncbi:MAG: ribosome recycling factor [Gemmatimonadota bacterium]
MTSEIVKEASTQMGKSLDAVAREFSGVRTGKASPALIESVQVSAYGSMMPLKQTATVTAPEPSLLVVQPWDTTLVSAIAKGIQTADLGLNPSVDGNLIRVSIPPLNEERRKEMVRLLHRMAEDGRIAVRHARQKAKAEIESQKKQGEISEDQMHRQLDELQKHTDDYIERIDDMLARREAEVMEV